MIWHLFFARVKVNHRRVYPRILVKMCAVAMVTGLIKNATGIDSRRITKIININFILTVLREGISCQFVVGKP